MSISRAGCEESCLAKVDHFVGGCPAARRTTTLPVRRPVGPDGPTGRGEDLSASSTLVPPTLAQIGTSLYSTVPLVITACIACPTERGGSRPATGNVRGDRVFEHPTSAGR